MTIWLDLVVTAAEVVVVDWAVAEEVGATQAFWFKTF